MKDILNFRSDSIFFGYKNIGIVEKINQQRKCISINFHKTTPVSRILVSLSFTDDISVKIIGNDIENVIKNIHDFRENLIYMLSFEKLLRDNNGKLITEDEILSN